MFPRERRVLLTALSPQSYAASSDRQSSFLQTWEHKFSFLCLSQHFHGAVCFFLKLSFAGDDSDCGCDRRMHAAHPGPSGGRPSLPPSTISAVMCTM